MADKAKPKRKPFMDVGVPRPPTVGGPAWPSTAAAGQTVASRASAAQAQPDKKIPLDAAPAGRPVSNIGQYLIKPTSDTLTGFEMLNDQPDILDQVHQRYLKAFELPPALQPKYLRKPAVTEGGVTGRATNISRGWRNPRSRRA